MTRNEAYREAEKKIEEARRTGATALSLTGSWDEEKSLSELPEALGQLTQLQELYLSQNGLTELPEWLGRLTQLRSLDVSFNSLKVLGEWVGNLRELTSFNLYRNDFLALPASLCNLVNLQGIYFAWRGEGPTDGFPESIRCMKQLRDIQFAAGGLTSLPSWLDELTRLEVLDFHSNQLNDLPLSLTKLRHLKGLNLSNNPLNPELAAANAQGVDAVLAYLRAKTKEKPIVLNEAKLVLVGEGNVGKSCLLGALRGDPWVEKRPTTHGIELKSVEVTNPASKQTITLNGWDFGGQDVYKPTHQLFFSTPAVYLVVWKPREGQQAGAVAEWIKLVQHRAPGAKIFVVATHGGVKERQPDIDRQVLWGRFGTEPFVGFFHVDSKPLNVDPKTGIGTGPGAGIAELRDAIAGTASKLPEVGRTVPQSWQMAREAFKKTEKPYLPLATVRNECKRCGMDDEAAKLFITLSHHLGHLIHYGHDPALRDIVILKPDWLATAISFVLDDKQTRANNGLVTADRLAQLWNDPARKAELRYEALCYPIFCRLMERFDLAYRVTLPPGKKTDTETYLIAQLVPDVRPEEKLASAWPATPFGGQTQQTQICKVVDSRNRSAPAEGLLYQLIVRLHRYSLGRANYDKSIHWQRGVVLEDTYGSRALLEHVENDIRITVRAPFPDRFLAILTEEVKSLVESFWEELRCDVTVPCLNPKGWKPPCDGAFKVAKLLENSQRHRDVQECKVCEVEQNIHQLLYNSPAARPDPLGELVLTELLAVRGEIKMISEQAAARHGLLIGLFDQADVRADARSKELVSKVVATYEELMRTLLDEAKDGPRLFSFEPVDPGFWDRPKWVSEKFRFTLWCEHSRLPLPELNKTFGKKEADLKLGVYEVTVPRKWFAAAAPVLKVIGTTLSLVLPVAGALAKVTIAEATYKGVEKQLDLGVKSAETVLKAGDKLEPWLSEGDAPVLNRDELGGRAGAPIRAAGGVLHQLHAWLKEKDPSFGGLEKVLNKRKEFLWVHPHFASEY
jgi:hypothetical protein